MTKSLTKYFPEDRDTEEELSQDENLPRVEKQMVVGIKRFQISDFISLMGLC